MESNEVRVSSKPKLRMLLREIDRVYVRNKSDVLFRISKIELIKSLRENSDYPLVVEVWKFGKGTCLVY